MGKAFAIPFLIIIISLVIGVLALPYLPEKMASHWDIEGNIDGYTPKVYNVFLLPIVSFCLLLIFLIIPKIDPLKANIEKFRGYFNNFVLLIIVFLFYIYLLVLFWNFGYRFSFIKMILPAFSILFYYTGVVVAKAKRNWFVGIRTPWTLSSDKVWDATHKLGGILFKVIGVLSLSGFFFEKYSFYLVVVPALLVAVITMAYSYFKYIKETRKRRH